MVTEPVREPQEAYMRLRWVGRLMKERAELVQEGEPVEGASLVMLVDGLEDLAAGPHAADSLDLLDRIVRDGRELGVYLVASSRGSGLVEQLSWGARLVGRCRDAASTCPSRLESRRGTCRPQSPRIYSPGRMLIDSRY